MNLLLGLKPIIEFYVSQKKKKSVSYDQKGIHQYSDIAVWLRYIVRQSKAVVRFLNQGGGGWGTVC